MLNRPSRPQTLRTGLLLTRKSGNATPPANSFNWSVSHLLFLACSPSSEPFVRAYSGGMSLERLGRHSSADAGRAPRPPMAQRAGGVHRHSSPTEMAARIAASSEHLLGALVLFAYLSLACCCFNRSSFHQASFSAFSF